VVFIDSKNAASTTNWKLGVQMGWHGIERRGDESTKQKRAVQIYLLKVPD